MTHHDILQMRRTTKSIQVGSVFLGHPYPVRIQSMTNTDTRDVSATSLQIGQAACAGAEIMRVSVPDHAALEALPQIIQSAPVPIVADIHFSFQIAVGAINAGVHKLRINPGNIGSRSGVREIVAAAADHGIPIRVGVNAGSLEKDILAKYGKPTAEALAESALRNAGILAEAGFEDIVLSLKSSDVPTTVKAYRIVAEKCSYPLHIGVTEAGTLLTGAIRSAVGLGLLLSGGIGDTLRVSLAADPVHEVRAGYRILEALGLRKHGPTIIACPTCSRTQVDIIGLASDIEQCLADETAPLTVAVMGCPVNGPGEAAEADLGVAGGKNDALLFRKGKVVGKVEKSDIFRAIIDLFHEVAEEGKQSGRR